MQKALKSCFSLFYFHTRSTLIFSWLNWNKSFLAERSRTVSECYMGGLTKGTCCLKTFIHKIYSSIPLGYSYDIVTGSGFEMTALANWKKHWTEIEKETGYSLKVPSKYMRANNNLTSVRLSKTTSDLNSSSQASINVYEFLQNIAREVHDVSCS